MKIFANKKRAAAIGAMTAATLVGGTVAFAYFTTTGSGTGTATAGSATNWDVKVTNTDAKNLTPTSVGGSPSQTVSYTIQNDSDGQQFLASATISVASVTQGSVPGPNACTTGDFAVGGEDPGDSFVQDINDNREAGQTYDGTVALRLVDNGANQDRCQGATVTLSVVAG
jgi:hypothetical protein